jgi:hypothetical protein
VPTAGTPTSCAERRSRNALYERSANIPEAAAEARMSAAIVNLDDDSRTLIAELGYTGITNIELRGRVMWLQGARFSEFAEKPNARKAELRARWSF